ncbi:hypothetical protein E4U21_001363 [Claviceps maximensis]|nr:hypothetical protein E4U21_001363 [Claviceps maximensis]
MSRPSIIRADTLELQNPAAPSAKDHTDQPRTSDSTPSISTSSTASQQVETRREVAQETEEAETQNSTLSWSTGSADDTNKKNEESQTQTAMYNQQQQDDLAIAQNGGVSSADEDDVDGESGSDMDDDIMDKISSSPSIEDDPALDVESQRQSSELDECELCHGGPSAKQENRNGHGVDVNGHNHLRNSQPILARQFPFDKLWAQNHDDQILLHGQDSRDASSQSHRVPVKMCFSSPLQGDEVIDQLLQSIDSFHYDDTPDEVDIWSDDECLLKLEDIDFEFVYALHTFVATVEGQANATKGDTMVLLDDSNSYWWLVRVVKDSSIGYLPAEHIETPTERLARLNKHRNIDLSATMLGDQAQKQKNSFKSIRKRRKTVTFSEPTYVDYSDFDYSTDDEDIDELFGSQPNAQQQREQRQQQHRGQQTRQQTADDGITDKSAVVEPLKTRTVGENKIGPTQSATEPQMEDDIRSSDELMEDRNDGLSRSRNGVVRNTDSFFKDDSVETKKITLTPNLLRDDNTPRQSSDSTTKDGRSISSMDKMDRELVSDREKKKLKDKDKKDKEKKPGGLRGFFSRKDKKKAGDEDDDSFGKRSMDLVSESRNSEDRSLEDHQQQLSPDRTASQRHTAKLQKTAPPSMSKTSAGIVQKPVELSSYLAEGRNNDVSNVPPVSMRIVGPETSETQHVPSNQGQGPDGTSTSAPKEERMVTSKLIPSLNNGIELDGKPQNTIKTTSRMELDESDSSEELDDAITDREAAEKEDEDEEDEEDDDDDDDDKTKAGRSIRSPPMEKTELLATTTLAQDASEKTGPSSPSNASQPPALMVDTSSADDVTPEASPSPELVIQTGSDVARGGSSSSNGKEAVWDDTKLRTFFDESEHIRDLLVVVYDKTNIEPAGNDHPVVSGLFREQNAKLAEITTQLDNMLGDWLARKQRLRGAI